MALFSPRFWQRAELCEHVCPHPAAGHHGQSLVPPSYFLLHMSRAAGESQLEKPCGPVSGSLGQSLGPAQASWSALQSEAAH